ncbi:universal stress protein (plasmid) [Halorussus salilacus]|uniref:universal stress protein n=1 Tax=Halorussus salilacus TaxID=2953750 RepID=UPI00209EC134|nr:universal stress protein [Halorussus salilacus]USZ69829.1 universal stress protein [Halorussus salilacus]
MAQTILVPHDGSEDADEALRYAMEQFPDDELVVFHVVEPFPDHVAAATEDDPGDWETEADRLAAEVFDDIRSRVGDAPFRAEWRYGRPKHEIVHFAEDNDVDQIVMGSHGRDGMSRILLGSIAEVVCRRAPVPVTVVR